MHWPNHLPGWSTNKIFEPAHRSSASPMLRSPLREMLAAAVIGGSLLLFYLYTSVASMIDPYEPYFAVLYVAVGFIAVFCVPIIVSIQNDLMWPSLSLGALLILSIPALFYTVGLVAHIWSVILLNWPATLSFYALISAVERRLTN